MKKLLGLIGTITMAGSGMTGIIGNAPTQAKNEVKYLQTNNLEKLNRVKRNNNRHLHHLNKFNLSDGNDYLRYLAFCYFYNKNWNQHGGDLNPDSITINTTGNNNNSILNTQLKTLSNNINYRQVKSEVISHSDIIDIFGGTVYMTNNSNVEQDKLSTMVGQSKSYSVKRGFKISAGFKAGIKAEAGIILAKVETSFELSLGLEYNQEWTSTETISITPTLIRVPAKSKIPINFKAQKNNVKINGFARVKVDPNQIVNILNHESQLWERITLISLINQLKNYNYGDNLFNSNKYLTLENNELFANIPYELIKENYSLLNLEVGQEIRI